MILVFDLDDTLYEELDFVRSGFRSVAKYIATRYALNQEDIYLNLTKLLDGSRGTIFDKVLKDYNIFSKLEVRQCLKIYRSHKPDIHLYSDASDCLERFSFLTKFIVTDGNKFVQANKIDALKLNKYMKGVYITHRYGLRHAKPSDYVFQKICKRENVEPSRILYIGDNPHKDFVGIKPWGFRTIRIIRGNYKDIQLDKTFEAEKKIYSLDEITTDFLKSYL